tara:strand:- start:1062 stop:1421 length:360 start_codon:yes stop_codon:yes gene_type:complete
MPIPRFELDKHGNITMSMTALLAVGVLGGSFYSQLKDLNEHLLVEMHPGTAEVLQKQAEQLNRVEVILIRGEITSYVSRICTRADSPNIRAWQSELERLLGQFESLTGTPFSADLLECE